jgi:hypothetical protein
VGTGWLFLLGVWISLKVVLGYSVQNNFWHFYEALATCGIGLLRKRVSFIDFLTLI